MKNSKFMKATAMFFTMILLIGSTFAENVDFQFNGDDNDEIWHGKTDANWDDHRESVSAYIYMDVLDDDGNDAAYLSVTVGRSYYGKWTWANGNEIDAVEYSASACVYSADWEGKANAWVQVPQPANPEAAGNGLDQQKGNIGGAGNPSSVSAYKSCKRDKGGINVDGRRKATASAAAWLGGISANIRIDISEF